MKLCLHKIPRSSALPPVLNSQAQRRQLPAKMPLLPAACGLSGPAGRMAGGPTPALTAKGQGRAHRRCVR